MVHVIIRTIWLLLFLPSLAQAVPAIACHCFTERLYDPVKPTAADPYLLATTQNSFFAAYFNADKKTIVFKKQSGSSADDLWVAYWVALKSGGIAEQLLGLRESKESWKEVFISQGLSLKPLGGYFASEAAAGASSATLARIIVDDVLMQNRLLRADGLNVLRKERASNQEVIISALIAYRTKKQPVKIFREVKSGMSSWGSLMADAGFQASALQSEFSSLLKNKGVISK